MVRSKGSQVDKKRRRTSLEIEEEQTRTLYIRIPHTIKDVNEIKSLFFGNFRVKLPRQSSRYCHVIFSNLEEKIKNMKAIKKKVIDGKPIYAGPPKPFNLEKKKKPKKKIVIPEPKQETKIEKYLFVSNIPSDTKASEIKNAFPGSLTVALFQRKINGKRQAKVKLSSHQSCLHYVKNQSEWPIIHGKRVSVALSKKTNNNNKKKQKKENLKPLEIYDKEKEPKSISKTLNNSEHKIDNVNAEENVTDEDVEDEEDTEDEEDVEEEENEETEDSNEEVEEDSNEEE